MSEHPARAASHPAVSRLELFTGFILIGMFGFGGIAAAAYHVIVERRRWLSAQDYAAVLGLGQVLPGANLINMATIVGDRFQGLAGAILALGGVLAVPLVLLVILASVYDHFSALPDVRSATLAAAAGAVGLTVGTSIKLARTVLRSPQALVFALASFGALGLLRLPMLLTIGVLVPLAIGANVWRSRRA